MNLITAIPTEVRTLIVLALLLLLPGWAVLSITQLWKRFTTLQRWIMAAGISIAFYPVLFYGVRAVLPQFQIGPNKLWAFILICLLVIIWQLRKSWKEQFAFEKTEYWGILIFAITLLIRFWMAHQQPYPAWSDSVHHTLLTQLTATTGRLPFTLEPYEPVALDMYHLGLYSLSGPLTSMAQIPAHSGLLWMAQALNGLCGLGIYLLLDRKVGRQAAIIGAAVAGIFCLQPAWYVNWGRFTQASAQSILLIAGAMTWETIDFIIENWFKQRWSAFGMLLITALLNAGTFLLHYRVAVYYLPLLSILVCGTLIHAIRNKRFGRWAAVIAGIGIVSLVFIWPAVQQALPAYIVKGEGTYDPSTANLDYYTVKLIDIFKVGIQKWLLVIAAVSIIGGFIARQKLSFYMLIWVGLLFLLGNTYRLGINVLNVTNLSAIFIMIYLPAAIWIGVGVQVIVDKLPGIWRVLSCRGIQVIFLVAVVLAALQRTTGVESYRYFMTPADQKAMTWITNNTPENAVFAINTITWGGGAVHGTDGGYWIPYFTGRQTTTGTMLYFLGERKHLDQINAATQATFLAHGIHPQINDLCAAGADYIYIGAKGNFAQSALNKQAILIQQGTGLLYDEAGVAIISICKP